jgi:transposase
MEQISAIGLDIAKQYFQVHGADNVGNPVLRRKLRRNQVLKFFTEFPRCRVGIEACSTAHHWARAIAALGHEVRLIPPQYVKPFVKRSKTDASDAEAIYEAMSRPTMRFVTVKSKEQQAALMVHRARDVLVRQRTQLSNSIRSYLAEFGLVAAQSPRNVAKLLEQMDAGDITELPAYAHDAIAALRGQLSNLTKQIDVLEAKIIADHRCNSLSRRLATIPGIGPITATLMAATISDPKQFSSARTFAAWIGLVPREYSSGGKQVLGSISKKGNPHLRRLLIIGAHTVLRWSRRGGKSGSQWLKQLLERRPANVAATALANKTARIAWAIMVSGETYRAVERSAEVPMAA